MVRTKINEAIKINQFTGEIILKLISAPVKLLKNGSINTISIKANKRADITDRIVSNSIWVSNCILNAPNTFLIPTSLILFSD